MRYYRCYFLDADGHVLAAEVVQADTDEEALARAAEMLSGRPHYRSIEVWDGARRIFPQPRDSVDVDQINRVFDSIALQRSKDVDSVS